MEIRHEGHKGGKKVKTTGKHGVSRRHGEVLAGYSGIGIREVLVCKLFVGNVL